MGILKSKRRLCLVGVDLLILLALFLINIGIMLVMDKQIPSVVDYLICIGLFTLAIFAMRGIFRVYSNVWRYANSSIYIVMVIADALAGVLLLLFEISPWLRDVQLGFWQSALCVSLVDIATLSSRFVYQIYYNFKNRDAQANKKGKAPVAIVGAGQVGSLLAQELVYNQSSLYYPICFIDTDKDKIGSRVLGIPVYPENDQIIDRINELAAQEIFIALPKLSSEETKKIHEFYAKSGKRVKIYDFPIKEDGEQSDKRVIRDIKIEDLLFRESKQVFGEQKYYSGKTVLVTGGGGSIGSELCRQVAKCSPKELVIFDIYENNAYEIQQELIRKYGDKLVLSVEIGSVRDRERLDILFEKYRPDIVIHAAAHKHVPLMETSPAEAVKNNIFGTYNTADMAEKYGVEKFILISTDKAVNPTNVMGATKRVCEMVIQCRADSKTSFCAVRFGNVLGSNGSVIPLFKKQIENGGPVTITDKRIIRYFMTIPEAAGLVMQAGAMAGGGDLFVLDMGKPVKILELAENMIKLSGLTPYQDIEIREIGLRPGEKLYEELLIKTEKLTKTDNDLIFIERDTPFTRDEVEVKLEVLREALRSADTEEVKSAVKQVVPTYKNPDELNSVASTSAEMQMI